MNVPARLLLVVLFAVMTSLFVAERSQVTAAQSLPLPQHAPSLMMSTDLISTTIYLPFVSVQPTPRDFTITGLEITQSVQNPYNSVSLVANRATVVRVYVQDVLGGAPPVYVSLTGTHNGVPMGTLTQGLATISTAPSRASLASSFNFTLPPNWITAGTLDLVAKVDSTNLVSEANEANNTFSITLGFNAVPALNLKIVPIAYTHTGAHPGFFAAPTADTVSDWIRRSYPVSEVNVLIRTPFSFTGNLTVDSEWDRLLDAVTTQKSLDGAPSSQVYYALIPTNNDWWNGDVPAWGGYSWIGYRVGVGLNYPWSANLTSRLAVHEIGHNFGLLHVAGCSNPAGIDPAYPYANGSIGQYGLDISPSTLYTPASNYDFMTYCSSSLQWWSDYHYQKLYNDQRIHGLAPIRTAAQNSLLIRASLNAQSAVTMLPIYSMTSVPTVAPSSSEYAVQLLDASGKVISSHPVTVLQPSEGTTRAIHALVPFPSTSVASVRIVRAGAQVAERAMITSRAPIAAPAVESAGTDFMVRWNAASVPSIVQYIPDSGSPITLGVDVTNGELRVDARTLPSGDGHFEILTADNPASNGRVPSRTITVNP